MTKPQLTGVHFNDLSVNDRMAGKPLLVLGPSLGTSVHALWGACAARLTDQFRILGWDLPGHGGSQAASAPFDIPELAAAVLDLVDTVLIEPSEAGSSFVYAGDSVGGAVGLQLLLDHPGRVGAAAIVCSGAQIAAPAGWFERAETVRASGTAVMVEGSAARWFAPGFIAREPRISGDLLQSLQDTERNSYAWVCESLAAFDVRGRLGEITVPVLAVAGAQDVVTPPASAQEIATGVKSGRTIVIDNVAHLAPAEAPDEIAELVRELAFQAVGPAAAPRTVDDVYAEGMRVRRAVLGDAHVDRASSAASDFTAEFQSFITSYAWGSIWTRPGLDRRSRSLITLTALVARGHHEELALHLRAARTNGLTNDEIKELLLQTAIYCGVPAANTAFGIADRVLREFDAPDLPTE